MKCGSHFAKCLLPGALLLAAGFVLLRPGISKIPGDMRMEEINNNPDKFHLCATNSAYDYSFTYDPRAADEWLFHTGGRMNTNLHSQ